jgi:hypothetical protein
MKKLLVLFNLLILCASISAQFILKADLYKERSRADTTMEWPNWNKVQKDSTLITFKTDSIFAIGNEWKDTYKLNKILEWSDGTNNDNDRWNGFIAIGTDSDGLMVKLTIMKYISGTVLITVTYGNTEFRYQCRKYKPIYPTII